MFNDAESTYLVRAMQDNKVVLLLGAGASYGSKTSDGRPIPLGQDLETFLRALIGNTDLTLRLDQIGNDVREMLGDDGLRRKLEEQFLETRPSTELEELFSYIWNRCYTLNYDDTIEGIQRHKKKQRHKYYVGTDKVEERNGSDELQVVHLNGSILKFEKGIVLTDKEFRSRIRKHTPWYEQCAADYASKTFVFIGTRLDEPIFKAYIESIEEVSSFAKSFLITPSGVSDRDSADLATFNITCKSNNLSDFLGWMKSIEPAISRMSSTPDALSVEIGSAKWISSNIDPSATGAAKHRRNFYAGMYPTWQCVASDWPANLSTMLASLRQLSKFIDSGETGLCIFVGQSGSGKTTCLMNALYKVNARDDCRVFDFTGESAAELEQALKNIRPSASPDVRCIIRVTDFQIFANEVEKISRAAKSMNVIVVGELRNSDWSGRFFGKHKEASKIISIPRLIETDYEILADVIQEFATAPEFRKLEKVKQIRQLKKSRSQLLILMLEATKQRPFEEIIENEYISIQDEDAQAFLCIVALITATRSRLSISDYSTIISMFGLRSSLATCLAQLEGIVEISTGGMLVGRHESYLGHIISKAAELGTVFEACLSIFRSFTVYEVPFVINAGRLKGNILKYMIRGSFLLVVFRGDRSLVERLYEELEYDYQNDGHFWLQRGKFARSSSERDSQQEALAYFVRSVEAYDNPYAQHSLAQQKLIYCAQYHQPTPHLEALLEEGVTELKRQIIVRQDAEDEYPIVALATSHPKVLLTWGKVEEARKVCRAYHAQLIELDKEMFKKKDEITSAIRYCLQVSMS